MTKERIELSNNYKTFLNLRQSMKRIKIRRSYELRASPVQIITEH